MGSYQQSSSKHNIYNMIFRPLLLLFVVSFLFYFSTAVRVCSDGSAPTCEDGSTPTRDMNRATPPCPGQGRGRQAKPNTCPDGQPPTKQRQNGRRGQGGRGRGRDEGQRGRGGQGRRDRGQGGRGRGQGGRGRGQRCSKSSKICCDGSTPNFDRNRRTSHCENGRRAKCSQSQCSTDI